MYRKYHTKGIVISSKIEGDSNKRVNIFTENFGLLNARVQDFSFGDFSLIHGKTGWKVVSSRAEQNFYEVFRNSQTKLKIVNNVLNLIKKLVSEEEAYTPLFSVVSNFLNFLITAKEQDVALSECLTLLRILHILGFMRHDPEFSIPISSSEIKSKDLEAIAPKRSSVIKLINESLKAT